MAQVAIPALESDWPGSRHYSWDQCLDFLVLGLLVLFALRLGLQFSPSVLGYNIIDGVHHHVRLFPEKV